ncbi:amidohydrolase family protein [Paenibacillus ginsengarvi]|uniref:Amidohydrolase n=1 Tax=Paenibacillus ginsengarvi TaxID=400777 RepID=A0A3B0BLD9_9BACL|nr:amidohydrolase family protein [Paenibacillus ginsengarvi]RKN72416.1 amidohydrolase [Paenibacillus ginsengarvi]
MIIDAHTHIWGDRYDESVSELLRACELFGISKLHVSGLKSHYPGEEEVAALNRDVYRFMREQPELVEGYCYVNPAHANAEQVLRHGIEQYGMSGMKLWVATYCDDPRVYPLVEICIEAGIPILIHSFYKTVGQLAYETTGVHVANLAERYPQAKLLMAHFGGNCYHGIKAVRGYRNVWHDFSGSPFRRDDLDYAVERVGADRIVYGSDMPITYLVNYGQVLEADLTQEQKDRIMYRNALELFDRSFRLA